MVDKENQWEDIEYSDDSGDVGDYNSGFDMNNDYSDDEYQEDAYSDDEEYGAYEESDEEAYDDEFDYEDEPKKGNPAGLLIVLLLVLLIIGLAVYFLLNKSGSKNNTSAPKTGVENSQMQISNETTSLGDDFFNEASKDLMTVDFSATGEATVTTGTGNDEIVATVMEAPKEEKQQAIEISNVTKEEEKETSNVADLFPQDSELDEVLTQGTNEIMVAYNKKARQNPFKPIDSLGKKDVFSEFGGQEFEIIEPPTSSVADENLTKLLQTQISGILYDDISPSAIVNLNGIDQFVKIGDTISGYKIESITRDKVEITYNGNTYVASVGELFTRGTLEKQRAVVNLENKFAGRYKNIN